MYSKKQRIIGFLMAFLLIFTFAFINPLTVSQSQAFSFAIPILTPAMGRIITGVLVSAGFIIHEGATPSSDYDLALMDMSRVIYQTLDNAQKILLGALSIVDNVVEVPISLYNSIVNGAKKVIKPDTIESLINQNVRVNYVTLTPSIYNSDYPELVFPICIKSDTLFYNQNGIYTERKIDLREAQPFFVYEGTGSDVNQWEPNGVRYFFNDIANDNLPVHSIDGFDSLIFITPDLTPYQLKQTGTSGSPYYVEYEFLSNQESLLTFEWSSRTSDGGYSPTTFISIEKSVVTNINDCIIYSYFLHDYGVSNKQLRIQSITDVYDKTTGNFLYQIIKNVRGQSIYNGIIDNITSTPYSYDLDLVPETTVSPTIPNSDASANVLTLPTELSSSIGLTSTDVNVGTTTDTPGTDTGEGEGSGTNTETMDNINTNVGELVTGGELGEQVNTNIGSVEGLHGEITEQVDFGAVFDTIAQYISVLDISSVTWFPTAVASFMVPFLPVISLGIVLFFIDRVLNGGA